MTSAPKEAGSTRPTEEALLVTEGKFQATSSPTGAAASGGARPSQSARAICGDACEAAPLSTAALTSSVSPSGPSAVS
jgi:hypothetical protein